MSENVPFSELLLKTGLTPEEAAKTLRISARSVYRYASGEKEPSYLVMDKMEMLLREQLNIRYGRPANSGWFKFIDLFAGIGGIRKGFESIGGECVFTSEWNEMALKTYVANFPGTHEYAGDITQIHEDSLPEFDVLLAGFPCQPFSIAGVSKKNSMGRPHGFMDETQGTLFFDVVRILKARRPKAFLLENVKNLTSHDKGNTFRVIKGVLEKDLGYTISTRIIDAAHFLPQHRERIFIAGFLEDTGFSFDNLDLPEKEYGPKLNTILHGHYATEENEPPYYEDGVVNPKYTLTDGLWSYLQSHKEKHSLKGNGFGFGLVGASDIARTLSARYYKDGSEILIYQQDKNPRRLTPRECARLMGFDAPNEPPMKIVVSDTQAYKQFGNSVAVPVIKAIARHMERHIKELVDCENTVQALSV